MSDHFGNQLSDHFKNHCRSSQECAVGAADRWGEITPSLSEDLHTLVFWGDGQTQNLSEDGVRRMLDGTVTKVVNDFSDKIGLWNV